MKKLIIPVILVSLGTGAAFATSAKSNDIKAPATAYRVVEVGPNQTICVDAQQTCSDQHGPICTWSADPSVQLHRFDTPTMCGDFLYKVPQL